MPTASIMAVNFLRIGSALAASIAFAAASLTPVPAQAQSSTPPVPRAAVPLPDEAAGLDAIVRALVGAFDHVDVLALGEDHGRRIDSELRIALVRHPAFAQKVRSIVVEFGSVTEQPTLDRYIRGENVSSTALSRVWNTLAPGYSFSEEDARLFADFFAAVREVNAKLPTDKKIRVLGGDRGRGSTGSREATAVSILKDQVLQKQGKALVIYGAAHFYRTAPADFLARSGDDTGIIRRLDPQYAARMLSVIPIGGPSGPAPAGVEPGHPPEYRKFDRALKTTTRPVLVTLQRPPFRDFTAEEFIGSKLLNCLSAAKCVSAFKGSSIRLGDMVDAVIYVGNPGT